mmetsp:Transcript_25457/g.55763  ORF Transcript_25457/g.55763 Transcript_25457/m.55763 type:complete len:261 (+) Transcript_25457:819-1601(+)
MERNVVVLEFEWKCSRKQRQRQPPRKFLVAGNRKHHDRFVRRTRPDLHGRHAVQSAGLQPHAALPAQILGGRIPDGQRGRLLDDTRFPVGGRIRTDFRDHPGRNVFLVAIPPAGFDGPHHPGGGRNAANIHHVSGRPQGLRRKGTPGTQRRAILEKVPRERILSPGSRPGGSRQRVAARGQPKQNQRGSQHGKRKERQTGGRERQGPGRQGRRGRSRRLVQSVRSKTARVGTIGRRGLFRCGTRIVLRRRWKLGQQWDGG